ncbi:hypothetical protein [Brevibacillus migulae]|uniref:hypothetical protein n=1 Tax=Brevibacillus migulae TaxID=1644114 RepID=UPI00106E8CB4|nr:hypothetical protein [Brevibacillus migulae]
MKKKYGFIITAALIVGIGTAWGYQEYNQRDSHGYALTKTYKSIDESVENSKLIINGTIASDFSEEKVGELVYQVYDVKVNKIYNNDFDKEIKEGDTIQMYRLIGYDTGKDIAKIVSNKAKKIDNGDYLFFLNGGYSETLKKEILSPNTPNQLFKVEDANKSLSAQSNSTEYKDVLESDAIPKITETELMKAIDKAKK